MLCSGIEHVIGCFARVFRIHAASKCVEPAAVQRSVIAAACCHALRRLCRHGHGVVDPLAKGTAEDCDEVPDFSHRDRLAQRSQHLTGVICSFPLCSGHDASIVCAETGATGTGWSETQGLSPWHIWSQGAQGCGEAICRLYQTSPSRLSGLDFLEGIGHPFIVVGADLVVGLVGLALVADRAVLPKRAIALGQRPGLDLGLGQR